MVPILQGPLRGMRWIAGSSNHGCWLGSYEFSKQHRFAAAVKPGDVVWDLGANVGFYTLLASVLTGSDGRVFSFEPAPRNLAFLRKHLDRNHVANCAVFELAVGSSDGTAKFELGVNNLIGHLATDANPPTGRTGSITVRVAALDRMVDSGHLLPPDVIKCDVEGGEADALEGAGRTLAAHRPTIFLATHGPSVHARCCSLLAGLGYELAPLDGPQLADCREILATPSADNQQARIS